MTCVCVPTGASPDSHPVCCSWGAALLQWGVWGLVHAGSGPWFPRHDWGRASHAAILLPGGGAADGKPDGSAYPQGQPVWDTGYLILLHVLMLPQNKLEIHFVTLCANDLPNVSLSQFFELTWMLDLNKPGLDWRGSFFMCQTWDMLSLFCLQALSMCYLKHCVALWQLLASLKSENMLRLKRVRHQTILPVHTYRGGNDINIRSSGITDNLINTSV